MEERLKQQRYKMEPNYEEKIKEIIKLMEERGYDVVAQLTGYLNENNEDYITRHGNTRGKIKEIPNNAIREYIESLK